ncbi:MAG: aliphatic sulfonate ABC transporter substrate-binding protein [Alphaproteobacteria bacterium]|nr:aliphatic sulfonate ABC transporter substrate-binding protein [Alphaproteobacteria bacterium]
MTALSPSRSKNPAISKRFFLVATAALAASLGLGFAGQSKADDLPDSIGIDYAYYNPVALLLKEKGWFEDEFNKDGIKVRWVLSLGSNKALEFLRGRSLDFGSTAGASAVIGRAAGLPIKAVYAYSKPEWTALVTRPETGIASIADLRGKRVAVTRGTDPHIFLLRALDSVGLTEKDIKPVLLQHPDGYTALTKGQVDAWAGLDPHMAKGELRSDATLFYRNADLNSYGILNVREEFAAQHPDLVKRVLAVYERGRKYAIENPDELTAALVRAARIDEDVAQKQLTERTDLSNPLVDADKRATLLASGEILQKIEVIKPDVDVASVVDDLIDSSYLASLTGN